MNISDLISTVAIDIDRDDLAMLPYAHDIFTTVLRAIPYEPTDEITFADLGSADGLLSAILLAHFPKSRATLIDVDEERLERSRERFRKISDRVTFLATDYARSDPPDKYNLVVSTLSIHRLNGIDKRALYRTLYSRLLPGGMFVNTDRVMAPTAKLQDDYRFLWSEDCRAGGVDEATISATLESIAEDHCSELEEQLEWIRNSGFRNVDVYYKNLMFAVFGGHRPDF